MSVEWQADTQICSYARDGIPEKLKLIPIQILAVINKAGKIIMSKESNTVALIPLRRCPLIQSESIIRHSNQAVKNEKEIPTIVHNLFWRCQGNVICL